MKQIGNDAAKCQGGLEQWKVDLINERVRIWGFTDGLADDAYSQCEYSLRRFVYEPSSGASEATAITGWLDKELVMLRRKERRLQARQQRYAQDKPSTYEMKTELKADVQEAIATLPPFEQRVCELLCQGVPIKCLRAELNCTSNDLADALRAIRFHFIFLGVDEWLLEK